MNNTLDRSDLHVYIVAGVPRAFKQKLRALVDEEAKQDGDVIEVNRELTEWLVARVQDLKRPARERTPASRALWRAYTALSAARYYLEDESDEEERVRELRNRVEMLWREVSPMFGPEGEPPH